MSKDNISNKVFKQNILRGIILSQPRTFTFEDIEKYAAYSGLEYSSYDISKMLDTMCQNGVFSYRNGKYSWMLNLNLE